MATDPVVAPTIIIIRKKKGHGGHHGGAWKVAYADFVTAMMALFIVLWLLSSSAQVKKAVGGYFQDPAGVGRKIGSGMAGTGDALEVAKTDMSKIKEKLEEAVKKAVNIQKSKDHVQMTVTGEGLRIELIETESGLFFESGNSNPSETGRDLLSTLAAELGRLPNRILIEGHTDSKPFSGAAGYTNWELSADRANAARRLMDAGGLKPGQVLQVRGFADQDLRTPKTPNDPSNRRISVIVKYDMLTPADDDPEDKKKPGEKDAKVPAKSGAPADKSGGDKKATDKPAADKTDKSKAPPPVVAAKGK